jgi:hypothetical protein
VTFDPAVQFERTGGNHRRKRAMTAEITTEIFREFEAKDVTDAVLTEAALLFSENYGVWDTPNGHPGPTRGIPCRFITSSQNMDPKCLANTGF